MPFAMMAEHDGTIMDTMDGSAQRAPATTVLRRSKRTARKDGSAQRAPAATVPRRSKRTARKDGSAQRAPAATVPRRSKRTAGKDDSAQQAPAATAPRPSKRMRTNPSTVPLKGAPGFAFGTKGPSAAKKKTSTTAETAAQRSIRKAATLLEEEWKKHGIEVLSEFKEILDQGMTIKNDQTVIGHDSKYATRMMRMTGSSRTLEQISKSEYHAQNRPSRSKGAFSNWNNTAENRAMFGQLTYQHSQDNNIGIAKRNNELSRNLLEMIPWRTFQFPQYFSILDGGKVFQIVEVPEWWNKKVKFHDAVAQLFGFDDMRHMCNQLGDVQTELRGMRRRRIIGNEMLPRRKGNVPSHYKNAGYRFIFKDDNNLRFDTSRLSSAGEDSKPSSK